MFNKLIKLFKEPEQGTVKLSFIALNQDDDPYEDIAVVPYYDEYIQADVESKFKNYMRTVHSHLVVEITILKVVKTSN
jgi:hypothetical protein